LAWVFRGVGLEQYPGFEEPLGRALSLVDFRLQMLTLCFAQFDHVFLYRDFRDGHGEIQIRLLRPLPGCDRKTPNLTRQL
jgi:hypothetical protein